MIAFNTDRTDEDLFAQYQHCGCREAFAELFKRYNRGLVAFVRRRGIIRDNEDIVQEVWIKLLTRDFHNRGLFRGLIFQTTKWEIKGLLRKSRQRQKLMEGFQEQKQIAFVSSYTRHGASSDVSSVSPKRQRQIELLNKALAQGPQKRVELFVRYYTGEETYRNLRESEGRTQASINGLLTKQRNQIRRIIESDGAKLAFVWTPENEALLGTATDKDIAKRLGISKNSVVFRRRRLGIPAFANLMVSV